MRARLPRGYAAALYVGLAAGAAGFSLGREGTAAEVMRLLLATPGTGFMPHGMCLAWQPGALWLNVVSDGAIALAYLSIPFALLTFIRRRKDLEFGWILRLFASFIFWCAVTHVMAIWVVWNPDFTAQGLVKLATALVSIVTAAALWPLIPKALALPSPAALRHANSELLQSKRELEDRVAERTRELEATRALLRSVMDSTAAQVAYFDGNDRLRLWNAVFERQFRRESGRAPESGSSWASVLGDRFRGLGLTPGEVDSELTRLLRNHEQPEGELELDVGGQHSLLRESQTPDGGSVTTVVDVTPLKAAERRLEDAQIRLESELALRTRAELRFSQMFAYSPSAMLMVAESGTVVLANRQAAALLGYPVERLTGLDIVTLIPGMGRPHRGFRTVLADQPRPIEAMQGLHARRAEGSRVPVEIRLVPLETEEGTMVLAALSDLTERQEAQRKLEERARALAASNAELDAFTHIASHDLKEPLRGIHNYAVFLLEDYENQLDPDGRAKLETLTRLSKRLEALIDTLSYFSRLGRAKLVRQPTDLNRVLADTLESVQLTLEEHRLEVRTPSPLPTLACDPVLVGEVFLNLITNACKYNDKPRPWIEFGVRTEPANGATVLYARDNGIGIPARYRDAVFKIFKRLHGRDKYGGGTGAGLTIVKKVVERHGGRIWVESEPGKGTSFLFTLAKEEAP